MPSILSDGKFATGNPRLPKPVEQSETSTANVQTKPPRKKLVVLCDGTGEDSVSSNGQNPTNVTRIARALSPNAWVTNKAGELEEWEQIVSYHAGIGTFEGNGVFGMMFGTGLSEIIRAAYGFLANNWDEGDKIYVFGFSRGAYIARSIAGLVAQHGLLTKRGMDNFHAVYETFYNNENDITSTSLHNNPNQEDIPILLTQHGTKISKRQAGLRPVPPGTVEVVGVFDTVAFHNPVTAWLNKLFRSRIFDANDRNEFQNSTLHKNVKYAFHALSLDETRIPFQTTLFFKDPRDQNNNKLEWSTTLKQVWFSGAHSDIGGGFQDPRLSNIALGWMISELEKDNLLAFDRNYLINSENPANGEIPSHWGTILGPNRDEYSNQCNNPYHFWHRASYHLKLVVWNCLEGTKWFGTKLTALLGLTPISRWLSGVRTPGEYVPILNFKQDKDAKARFLTCEEMHESIYDRWRGGTKREGVPADATLWPCPALKGFEPVEKSWVKRSMRNGKPVQNISPIDAYQDPLVHNIETLLKGRMRFEGRITKPWLANGKVSYQEHASPLRDPDVHVAQGHTV